MRAIRGPAYATFGMPWRHVRWQVPPITSRSPRPSGSARDSPPAVKRDAVAAIAIQRGRHVDKVFIARRQRDAHALDQRMLDGAREHARDVDDLVVDVHLLVAPRKRALELLEQRVVARYPARHVIDPRAEPQLGAAQRAKVRCFAESISWSRRAGRE